MNRKETPADSQGHSSLPVPCWRDAQLRKCPAARRSWWRLPTVGYLFNIPLIGFSLLIPLLEQHFAGHHYFLGTALFFATVLVALIWGTGPALFSLLLALLVLSYFFLLPFAVFSIRDWTDILILLPFCFAALLVVFLTSRLETARQRALVAEQEAQTHAEALAVANQELQEANQLKDRFLSMASHELKTPITVIRTQAQILLRRMAKQPEGQSEQGEQAVVRTAFEKIAQQTGRLNTLVDDLLDVSSIRAGRIKLRLEPCDLGEICHEVVRDQNLLSGRTVELVTPPAPVILQADGDRLSQVVVNLMSNAIKYSTEEGVVQVHVSLQTASAIIQVHNDGPAIPQEYQIHLFELFYRTPTAQSSSKQGWGLGLTICKDIVERHGGHIWVESSEGKGTTFFVELPYVCPQSERGNLLF
jgi:signal transduction histidine kinase